MNTFIKYRLCFSVLVLLSSLVGCVGTPSTLPNNDPYNARVTDNKALQQLRQGNAQAAADIYSSRAKQTSDPEQSQAYLLVAAEILFDRGLVEFGRDKLNAIPAQLSTLELQQRRDILVAKELLFSGEIEAAITALPDPQFIITPLDRARVFETRALAFNDLGDPDNELIARIELEKQLTDDAIIDKNHVLIWSLLTTQPLSELRTLTTNVRDDTYQGWIELAMINADANNNPQLRAQKLDHWRALFAVHPANARFVPSIYAGGQPTPFEAPSDGTISQIAVLLPLSDPQTASVANAIRDGIIAAHQNATNQYNRPSIRFYDVGENPAYVRSVYQNAINDGANAVIGPLRKQAVSAIVTLRDLNTPTLTLNTVDASIAQHNSNTQLVQFGLAPEDEAHSAASRAVALSMFNAVVLQADDARGDREARAFQDAMFRYGGDVVHVSVLPKDEYDYSKQIRDALQITDSDKRFHQLSSALGEKLSFEPSIRNDVDVIFLAVSTEQARSVRPQLDFFHATSIPRFGTSRIAAIDNNAKNNKDLNSIFYPDAPWVLRKDLQKDPLRQQIIANFPASEGVYAKLYALGADAYKVINNLPALSMGNLLEGYTGGLSLSPDNRIQRSLDWAQYQEGESVSVERIEADPLPSIKAGTM